MIRSAPMQIRIGIVAIATLLTVGCAESRQSWPPFCQAQALDGPGRMAGHHFTERDPWPMTTGTYDYLDYLGLDEQGRARIHTTSGKIAALGFIGGVGAGTMDIDPARLSPGTGPQPVHERLCLELISVTPDGAGGFGVSYRLSPRGSDGLCRPCPASR